MDYSIQLLEKNLSGKPIGHKIYYYQEISSTNDEAFKLAGEGEIEGTVVIADSQTRGKGRMQRAWHSPPGGNIYTSIILRPDIAPSFSSQIPIMAGIAVAEIIENYGIGRAKIKWPNDVNLNGKKICGILSQVKITLNNIDFIILGIGINVNVSYEQFPTEIKDIATSLAIEGGHDYSRQELIISLYENLTKWYKKLKRNGFDEIREKWLNMTPMIGCNIQVMFQDEIIKGRALDIDEHGSLILINLEGKKVEISAGDATILKENQKCYS
jgi:BirA family transcriptional regulator, biotin operon repressor / biotin---[acetyl-CoA-carboxylase] ligase